MNYKYFFEIEAQTEFYESVYYYASISKDLAFRFSNSIKTSVKNICSNPYANPKIFKNIRRFYVINFPFIIYYLTNENEESIHIISVFHTSRNPKEWKKRI